MNSFDNIETCYYTEYNSGVKCRLYYAPEEFFFRTPLPSPGENLESEVIIPEQIVMKRNKLLHYIDILIDENELKLLLTGALARKKSKINLSVFILGFLPSVLGFLERGKNIPFVFFIQDTTGRNWQIGHMRNRALIDNSEAGTGKKYEDNAGASITITCNSPVFLYNFSLDHFSKPGDFNTDFNNDFFTSDD
ncbi:hypothetical protein [Chryseobacterium arthrosphaerae]|uniref:hypothetical protein n=1 Tax=Chryseobacterium arthrosphaerae TaxID=651561 RepID=UPI00241EC9B3|nr:hypothetical protein [Chryseobacterium arthrosphaerae]